MFGTVSTVAVVVAAMTVVASRVATVVSEVVPVVVLLPINVVDPLASAWVLFDAASTVELSVSEPVVVAAPVPNIAVVVVLVVVLVVLVLFVDGAAVVTPSPDAHTLKPSPNTVLSLVHTSSAPATTFSPCGPAASLYDTPPTEIKSNPTSTSYCDVVITNGRKAFTLQFSLAPYSPSPSDTQRPPSTI